MKMKPMSLWKKIWFRISATVFAVSLFAVLLSYAVFYLVSNSLVKDHTRQLEDLFLATSVDRTNRYLGEMSEVVNQALSIGTINSLLLRADEKAASESNNYAYACSHYMEQLTKLVRTYDSIENVAFINRYNSFTLNGLPRGGSYERDIYASFQQILQMETVDYQDRFLVNLPYGEQVRLAVLFPIFNHETETLDACLAIIPDQNFARQLQFVGGQIYVMDGVGTHSFLQDGANVIQMDASLEAALVYKGWTLRFQSMEAEVLRLVWQKTMPMAILGGIFVVFSTASAYLFSMRLARPISDVSRAISGLAMDAGKEKSAYRVSEPRRSMSVKRKLMLLYIGVFIIPVMLYSMGFYNTTRQIYDEKLGYLYEHRINFLFEQVEIIIDRYKRAANELVMSAEAQLYLSNPSQQRQIDFQNTVLIAQSKNPELINILFYNKSFERIYSSFYADLYNPAEYHTELLAAISSDPYSPVWGNARTMETGRSSFSVAYGCFDIIPVTKTGLMLGYIVLEFDIGEIESLLHNFTEEGGAGAYLFDKHGLSVLTGFADIQQADILAREPGDDKNLERNGNVLIKTALKNYQWSLMAIIPRQEYLHEHNVLMGICISIIGALSFLLALIALLSTRVISRDLDHFVRFIKRCRMLSGERFHGSQSLDEVTELASNFNLLLDKLDDMVNREANSQMAIKNIQLASKQFELNLLQSQINPHFLYNTLKTVKYMVHINDPRAEYMIQLMIRLFRSGVSRKEELVTVREELNHVSAYYEIQNIRYNDKFTMKYDLQPQMENKLMLKMTLQPIVENAIYHGIELLERPGTITISIRSDENLVIEVKDDGVGMSAARLKTVRESLEGDMDMTDKVGIGIVNVHNRIQLYFGRPYGVTLYSRPGEGTRVVLLLPLDVETLENIH